MPFHLAGFMVKIPEFDAEIFSDSWGSVVNWLKSIESIGRKNGNKPNFPWLLKHP